MKIILSNDLMPFIPIFSTLYVLYSTYYSLWPRFDRTEPQIGSLFLQMARAIASNRLDSLDKVLKFYKGYEAPQLIKKVYDSIIDLEALPTNYVHPRDSLITLGKTVNLISVVCIDVLNSYIVHKLTMDKNPVLVVNIPNIDKLQRTKLHYAFKSSSIEEARSLLENGADINGKDKFNETPLIYALRAKNNSLIKLLIDSGANVNCIDRYSETPIFQAIRYGEKEIVELLAANGADLQFRNGADKTPLQYSQEYGKSEITDYLSKHNSVFINWEFDTTQLVANFYEYLQSLIAANERTYDSSIPSD